jgi:CheY-like chemotaxis protein
VPALVLSADANDLVRRQVAEHGLGLLQKPVRPLALKSMLGRLLAMRAATGRAPGVASDVDD